MKKIKLTNNKEAIISKEDYKYLSSFVWWENCGYAVTRIRNKDKRIQLRMHRVILGAKGKEQVDHINGDKLDNRRDNLRICNNSQNMANRVIQRNNTTGFKGVSKHKGKFRVRLRKDGKIINGGHLFSSLNDAAKKYNELAILNFGKFAKLNDINW